MKRIVISILHQSLELIDENHSKIYTVSTSKLGPGEQKDSLRTPRGKHIIRAKIGDGEPNGMIFKGRRPTGEIYQEALKSDSEDWILTRILWLSGKEPGRNRLGNVDTMQRYIYIHGVPDHFELGSPRSMGCINMFNSDIVDLFDQVEVGTEVYIN
tara:strand:+ start:790 stop:1257 length:468 start_codon:yes stop_codon:yes gene_type:complete